MGKYVYKNPCHRKGIYLGRQVKHIQNNFKEIFNSFNFYFLKRLFGKFISLQAINATRVHTNTHTHMHTHIPCWCNSITEKGWCHGGVRKNFISNKSWKMPYCWLVSHWNMDNSGSIVVFIIVNEVLFHQRWRLWKRSFD